MTQMTNSDCDASIGELFVLFVLMCLLLVRQVDLMAFMLVAGRLCVEKALICQNVLR